MNTKRNTLAYGVEEDEDKQPSQAASTLSAGQFLLGIEKPEEHFDATPFPDSDSAQTRIRIVRESLPDASASHRLAERFKALADPSRLMLLNALAISELRVGELAEAVSMSQSAVSHQLRVLRAAQLVAVRREGKNAWYRLADPSLACLVAPTPAR